jgi:hypothetical protein
LATRLEWCLELSDKDIQKLIKTNLLGCLQDIHQLDWYNIHIIIESLYKFSSEREKIQFNGKIANEITPSIFFKLKDIFYFLDETNELHELQNEISKVKEKCIQSPSRELCRTCMNEPKGTCWIRILSKITGVAPWSHGGFEVADVVVYALEQGIYFVIKSKDITGQRGEGDVLYRQCTQLFSNDHALVLYWNPSDTHPSVIENIKKNASAIRTNPRFEVVDKKYIRQVYSYYISEFEKRKKAKRQENLYSIFELLFPSLQHSQYRMISLQ